MVGELDRSKIRARFMERFSAERMARDYVELYRKAAQGISPTEPALPERVGRRNKAAGKAT
jgi:hypothetical protein